MSFIEGLLKTAAFVLVIAWIFEAGRKVFRICDRHSTRVWRAWLIREKAKRDRERGES